MSIQTNFRAVDMLGGVKAAEAVVEAPKKAAPKPVVAKVEEPVVAVEPEVVVEPVVEEPAVVVEDDKVEEQINGITGRYF